jgi:hypothetical protein
MARLNGLPILEDTGFCSTVLYEAATSGVGSDTAIVVVGTDNNWCCFVL